MQATGVRNQPGWRVAVVAHRNRPVTGPRPCPIVLVHDMTVGAGRRVVREVRVALRINEGIRADPEQQTDERSCDDQATSQHTILPPPARARADLPRGTRPFRSTALAAFPTGS